MALQAGICLHDRYRVMRRIGRGGMGAVYEAVDLRLRNTVAVKQLEIGGAAADRAFEREAQLLAGLRHPVLPVVIDYFIAARDAFLVMQYIEGEDLEHRLAREGRPGTREEVLAWAHALLDGLEYLHSRTPSIVHRDIKPANVKQTPAGDIVLLDFGLAKGRLDADPTVSPDSGLYGFTLQYAPPEQIDGRPTDVRSDLFALGATLYHLATGAPPATALQRTMAVRNGAPDPLVSPDAIHPPVGRVLGAAITRALQLDPAQRFASAAEMRSALSAANAPAVPRAEPTTAERRVDAALPTQVEVGRQTDLIVQVRFADSPLLGIEDWPTARRPERVEQKSEPLQVRHLVDKTGRLLPARVRIRLVAADFAIEGDAERVIEVPVNDYSKRMAFLLTAQRAGYCRVNVEVYALDSLFLGTVAVEAEAVSTQVIEATPNVAQVVLGTFARRAAAAPKPANPKISTTADTVRVKISPELAAAIAESAAAAAPAARDTSTAATILAPVPIAPAAAPSAVAASPQLSPATTHVPIAPSPALDAPTQVPDAPAPPPASRVASAARGATPRASLASRLPMFGGAAAAILIAGLVFKVWPDISRSVSGPPPETQSAPVPTAPPPSATTPAAPPAIAPPSAAPPAASRPPAPDSVAASTAPATKAQAAKAPDPVSQRPSPTPAAPSATRPAPEPARAAPVAAQPRPTSPAPPPAAAPPAAPPPPASPRVTEPPPPAPAPAPAPAATPAPPPPSPAAPVASPAPAAPPSVTSAPAPTANAGGSARVLEGAKKLEQSGELTQALAEYEKARQLLEADVTRFKEALQNGLVTRKRVEAVEESLAEATQSIARVRAKLDAQRPRKK